MREDHSGGVVVSGEFRPEEYVAILGENLDGDANLNGLFAHYSCLVALGLPAGAQQNIRVEYDAHAIIKD